MQQISFIFSSKKSGIKVIKCIIFISAFICIYLFVNKLFRPAVYNGAFHYEPKNTVDVLFLGSSRVFCSTNPNVLWQEEGISSYSIASTAQPVWGSYYYLVEALKNQKPKVVVLDALYLYRFYTNGYDTDYTRPSMLDFMSLSQNKWEALNAIVPKEDRLSSVFDFVLYHNSWRSLNKSNIMYALTGRNTAGDVRFKGFYTGEYMYTSTPFDNSLKNEEYPKTQDITELHEKNLIYLSKIIELSKKESFNLFLIAAPSVLSLSDMEEQRAYNKIRMIAEEQDIPFRDYNQSVKEIGLDYSRDFMDEGHLNKYGADKFSSYIGKEIRSLFHLTDRRSDPVYSYWNKDAEAYFAYAAMAELPTISSLKEYSEKISKLAEDIIVISSLKEGLQASAISEELRPFGITSLSDDTKAYVSIFDSSGSFENGADTMVEGELYIRSISANIRVMRQPKYNGNKSNIKVNGTECSYNEAGLNIIIFDKVNHGLIDRFWIQTDPGSKDGVKIQREEKYKKAR